jgi:hypothetical protein
MKNKTFKQIYDEQPGRSTKISPKEEWINKIAALTRKAPGTVRMWLSGAQQPDALTKSVLSEHFSIPEDQLFPAI